MVWSKVPEQDTHRVISAIVRHYGRLELPAAGDSMYPLIKAGDRCTFEAVAPADVRSGDIVLYADSGGRLVAHRFHRWTVVNRERFALCRGDANAGYDEPVPADRLIARLAVIRKRGASLRAGHPLLAVWGRAMLGSRYLSAGLRRYLNRRAGTGTP